MTMPTAFPPDLPGPDPAASPAAPARPLVSWVTVCRNALPLLPATRASLPDDLSQAGEWVVIDGASTDGSLPWLQGQRPSVLVSERDGGIYPAMNKGWRAARGEWVYFLNAGDRLNTAAWPRLAQALQHSRADIVYGDVCYTGSRGDRLRRFHWLTPGRLPYGDLCHQAVFCRRSLFDRLGPFDEALHWNADFDWLLRATRAGAAMAYLPETVAFFDDAGSHVQAGAAHEAERRGVRLRYVPALQGQLGHWALKAELKWRRWRGQQV